MTWRAAAFTLSGATVVVVTGILFSLAIPGGVDLLNDSQIASRTSPGLVDLISAVATGFAGSVAFARRDVAAVLPGVAIAISLVPPLAVVGVCLGQAPWRSPWAPWCCSSRTSSPRAGRHARVHQCRLRGGGRPGPSSCRDAAPPWRSALLLVVVLVPMAANTVGTYLVDRWTQRVQTTAEQWIAQQPGASIQSVTVASKNGVRQRADPRGLPSATSSWPTSTGRSRTASPSSSPRPSASRSMLEWWEPRLRARADIGALGYASVTGMSCLLDHSVSRSI